MSSASPNRLKDADLRHEALDELAPGMPEADESRISAEEAAALRREKVQAIRKAIAAGAYDSDELLEKAMLRMRESVENGE